MVKSYAWQLCCDAAIYITVMAFFITLMYRYFFLCVSSILPNFYEHLLVVASIYKICGKQYKESFIIFIILFTSL